MSRRKNGSGNGAIDVPVPKIPSPLPGEETARYLLRVTGDSGFDLIVVAGYTFARVTEPVVWEVDPDTGLETGRPVRDRQGREKRQYYEGALVDLTDKQVEVLTALSSTWERNGVPVGQFLSVEPLFAGDGRKPSAISKIEQIKIEIGELVVEREAAAAEGNEDKKYAIEEKIKGLADRLRRIRDEGGV